MQRLPNASITQKEAFTLLQSRLRNVNTMNEKEIKEYMSFADSLKAAVLKDDSIIKLINDDKQNTQ